MFTKYVLILFTSMWSQQIGPFDSQKDCEDTVENTIFVNGDSWSKFRYECLPFPVKPQQPKAAPAPAPVAPAPEKK